MTDQAQESALEVPETKELPVPETSGDSGDERPSTVGAVDKAELAKELLPLLREGLAKDPEFIRESQSIKDKRLRVLDGIDPEAMRKFNKYLQKAGGDEDTAIREMLIDQRILGATAEEEGPGKAAPSATVREPDPRVRLSGILDKASIPYDDPEYAALVEEYRGQGITEEFMADVRALARTRARNAPREVSAAVVAGEGAGLPPNTQSGLEQQYITKLRAARGNRVEIRRLRAEYEAKGVDTSKALSGIDLSQQR